MPQNIIRNKLNNLSEVSQCLQTRHLGKDKKLSMVLSYRLSNGNYFIFQEMYSFPFHTVIWNETNKSLTFSVDWIFEVKPKIYNGATLEEGNMDWSNIPTQNQSIQSGILNSRVNQTGVFERNNFATSCPQEKKKKKNKVQEQAWTCLRLENINNVDIWDWGFSVRSPTLTLVAYNSYDGNYISGFGMEYNYGRTFPYVLNNLPTDDDQNVPYRPTFSFSFNSIVHTDFSFSILSDEYRNMFNVGQYTQVYDHSYAQAGAPDEFDNVDIIVGYWSAYEAQQEHADFDEKIDDLAYGVKEKIKVRDIGQAPAKDILLD
tara:strand:- start:1872 stop:2822 length:951 start_codon:yes stop_codon:yes gene_type:complete